MNRKVYCVGETVYDIIFKNQKPVEAKPGGAMLNTAVSLGRMGIDVALIGDLASDKVGDIIHDFLKENNVDTTYITRYSDGKSRIALAFLDQENNADYSFYKIAKSETAKVIIPPINEGDIILFGSFYGIKEEIRGSIETLISIGKQKGALIIYDPNFRNAHKDILNQVKHYICQNMVWSHIVKGSDEDFFNIFGTENSLDAFQHIENKKESIFIYTANKYGVSLHTEKLNNNYSVPNITPLSTIGAGDTFNAGLIAGLIQNEIFSTTIFEQSEEHWNKVIQTAIEFATHVCLSYENYLSIEFAQKLKQ